MTWCKSIGLINLRSQTTKEVAYFRGHFMKGSLNYNNSELIVVLV